MVGSIYHPDVVLWAQRGIENWSTVYHLAMSPTGDLGDVYPVCQTPMSYDHFVSHTVATLVADLTLCQRCARYKNIFQIP